eukprot:gene262-884_t
MEESFVLHEEEPWNWREGKEQEEKGEHGEPWLPEVFEFPETQFVTILLLLMADEFKVPRNYRTYLGPLLDDN